MSAKIRAGSVERTLEDTAFVVSKTDARGRIVYANRTFVEISGYREEELLGSDHSVVRHPDMPRAMFKRMWDTLKAGKEFFIYIKSLGRDGSFYWGYANMVPSHDARGQITGYFSVRRKPTSGAIGVIEPLYRAMKNEEDRAAGDSGMREAEKLLENFLREKGKCYEEFVLDLQI